MLSRGGTRRALGPVGELLSRGWRHTEEAKVEVVNKEEAPEGREARGLEFWTRDVEM